MRANKSKLSAALILGFLIVTPVFAQQNDINVTTLPPSQYENRFDEYNSSKMEIYGPIGIDLAARGPSIDDARIVSVNEAARLAVEEMYKQSGAEWVPISYEDARDYVDRVEIIREFFDEETKTYQGSFDVWVYVENTEKENINTEVVVGGEEPAAETVEIWGMYPDSGQQVSQSDAADNMSSDMSNIKGPEWVLVIPGRMVDGQFEFADKSDHWVSSWRIPSRDKNTQFISTSGDADDRKIADAARSQSELARSLMDKYRASNALFVSLDSTQVYLDYWDSSGSKDSSIQQISLASHGGVNGSKPDYTPLKKQVINEFWSLYASGHRSASSDEYELGTGQSGLILADNSSQASSLSQNALVRVVGTPQFSESGLVFTLQVNVPDASAWMDWKYKLYNIPDVRVVSETPYTSSAMVRLSYSGADPYAIWDLLPQHGFQIEG